MTSSTEEPAQKPKDILEEFQLDRISKPIYFDEDTVLLKQGDTGTDLYFVKRGKLSVIDESRTGFNLATLHASDVFGEMSFLDETPRSATVRSKTHGEVWVISRDSLLSDIQERPVPVAQLLMSLGKLLSTRIRKAEAIQRILEESEENIADRCDVEKLLQDLSAPETVPIEAFDDPGLEEIGEWRPVEKEDVLITQFDENDNLFMIRSGDAEILDDRSDTVLGSLGAGDVFGETSFLDGSPHSSTVRATSHGVMLVIPREALLSRLEERPDLVAKLMLGIGRLLARRLTTVDRTLSVLADKDALEQQKLRRLLTEMRNTLRIKRMI